MTATPRGKTGIFRRTDPTRVAVMRDGREVMSYANIEALIEAHIAAVALVGRVKEEGLERLIEEQYRLR